MASHLHEPRGSKGGEAEPGQVLPRSLRLRERATERALRRGDCPSEEIQETAAGAGTCITATSRKHRTSSAKGQVSPGQGRRGKS